MNKSITLHFIISALCFYEWSSIQKFVFEHNSELREKLAGAVREFIMRLHLAAQPYSTIGIVAT